VRPRRHSFCAPSERLLRRRSSWCGELGAVLGPGGKDVWWVVSLVPVHGIHGGVAEVGGEGVEVLLRDRIKLVIVACGTSGGEAKPDGRHGFYAVSGVDGVVFLSDGSAFSGGGEAAVETGGDLLIERGFWKEVTSDLLDGEVAVAFVFFKGIENPVAVWPDGAVVVDVDAVGVGIASSIEPVAGEVFCVSVSF